MTNWANKETMELMWELYQSWPDDPGDRVMYKKVNDTLYTKKKKKTHKLYLRWTVCDMKGKRGVVFIRCQANRPRERERERDL